MLGINCLTLRLLLISVQLPDIRVNMNVNRNNLEKSSQSDQIFFHVIICTYNRCELLNEALAAIAKQDAVRDGRWGVMIVDNNCTDATADVVGNYVDKIPKLTRVTESRQGLTEARQCGILSTDAPWVGFVDDDCILTSSWVRNAVEFCRRNPSAAAFNGRNVLVLDSPEPKPWVHPLMFAGYDPGGIEERRSDGPLHGAGLVLRRKSVVRSGWLENPRAADRRGQSLISGGDNELSVRAQAGGGDLWFVPQCVLSHSVQVERLRFGYLARLNYRLAEAGALLTLMRTGRRLPIWHVNMLRLIFRGYLRALSIVDDPMQNPGGGVKGIVLGFCRAAGLTVGYLKLLFKPRTVTELHGLATREHVNRMSARQSELIR